MNMLAANSFPAIQKRDNRLISPWLPVTAAPRLPWQHRPLAPHRAAATRLLPLAILLRTMSIRT